MPLHARKLENIGCVLPSLCDVFTKCTVTTNNPYLGDLPQTAVLLKLYMILFLVAVLWLWPVTPSVPCHFPHIVFSHTTSAPLQQKTCLLCSLLIPSISSLFSFANKLSFCTFLPWIMSPSSYSYKGDSWPSGSLMLSHICFTLVLITLVLITSHNYPKSS